MGWLQPVKRLVLVLPLVIPFRLSLARSLSSPVFCMYSFVAARMYARPGHHYAGEKSQSRSASFFPDSEALHSRVIV